MNTKPDVDFYVQHSDEIKDLARVAITYSLEQNQNTFTVDDIKSSELRKRFAMYGSVVSIIYGRNLSHDSTGFDSVVTFQRISLSGSFSIIYDFAEKKKVRMDVFKDRKSPYLINVADRIFLRRESFPMM